METPLVTISIPSYKPFFFEQALRSAIGQTYPNIEIFVSDNCETDEILNICNKYKDINYIRNPIKSPANVINSLTLGRGEWVKPLFDDDILHPFCVQQMVSAGLKSNKSTLIFSSSALIDAENNIYKNRTPFHSNLEISNTYLIKNTIINFINFIGEFSTVLIKRESLNEVTNQNLYKFLDEDYSSGLADVAAFFNITRNRNAYYIHTQLSYFRLDNAHPSNSNLSTNLHFINCVVDWYRLILSAYRYDILSNSEMLSAKTRINTFYNNWITRFPEIKSYHDNYIDIINGFEEV